MEEIDWPGMWRKALEESSWGQRAVKPEYWDGRVDQFEGVIKQSNRVEMILSRIVIEPDYTILDIGAGPSTVTIPLAKAVAALTAIEPSAGMLTRLTENASKENVSNIRCINRKWEDVEIGTDIAEHDIVLASHLLTMLDIKEAVSKMNDVAKRYVYIFTFAGAQIWDYNTIWPKLYSEKNQPGPDYLYLYNVLYGMGIYANVEITNSEYKQHFSSLDEAVEQ